LPVVFIEFPYGIMPRSIGVDAGEMGNIDGAGSPATTGSSWMKWSRKTAEAGTGMPELPKRACNG
jgi:hypothetical protein